MSCEQIVIEKCEDILDCNRFTASPKDKEKMFYAVVGADQCSILSSNNTTTSPPSSPSLDTPQPSVPPSCSILTSAEFEMEYDRQHALETIVHIENYFKEVKFHFFQEKIQRLEEAIANIQTGKDYQVQKRIESAQQRTEFHLKSAANRRQVAHRCLANVGEATKSTVRRQRDSEIERTRVPTFETSPAVSQQHECQEPPAKPPVFRKPRKRPQNVPTPVVYPKRPHISPGPVEHASSLQSPIANQLRADPARRKSFAISSAFGTAILPDVPCMVYRLRGVDIESDLNTLRRLKSSIATSTSVTQSERPSKKVHESVVSPPAPSGKNGRSSRNSPPTPSKDSRPYLFKSLPSNGISNISDANHRPHLHAPSYSEKLSSKTKQLLKQKLSPRCVVAVPSPGLSVSNRQTSTMSRVVVESGSAPGSLRPSYETAPRIYADYAHSKPQKAPGVVQKPYGPVVAKVVTSHHRATPFTPHPTSEHKSTVWHHTNSFSPLRDVGPSMNSPASAWSSSGQCELSSIASMTDAVTMPHSQMKDFRIGEGSQL